MTFSFPLPETLRIPVTHAPGHHVTIETKHATMEQAIAWINDTPTYQELLMRQRAVIDYIRGNAQSAYATKSNPQQGG